MLRNYFKIAWRNLLKHPTTTSIHLIGLTLGLTTCLLILLFIQNEWGYDRHLKQGDRIYRVNLIRTTGAEAEKSGITPYPLAPAIRTDFADWSKVTRIHADRDLSVLVSPQKILKEDNVVFAEPDFIDLFDIEMVEGNGKNVLAEPNKVILTQKTAQKYFGSASALGKTLRLNNDLKVQVAGVMRDMPSQTNFPVTMLVSFLSMKSYFSFGIDQWGLRSGGSVFAVLPEGQSPEQYAARLRQAEKKYFSSRDGETSTLVLQPLHDIHFNPDYEGTILTAAISPTYLYVFGAVGLFVLLIACVNFINMSTARAMTRAKEVGVRKVIGATQSQLVWQFLSEALWLTGISALLSLLLTNALLPVVNDFLQKQITSEWLQTSSILAALALFTALLAGLYPAFFLARFRPIRALKTVPEAGGLRSGRVWLRQGLVVFQFSVSLILAVGVLIIYRQMNYFRQKDLGFKRDAIVTVAIPDSKKMAVLGHSLRQIPGVEHLSFALGAPTSPNNFGTDMRPDPANPTKKINISLKLADADYLKTYGLKLVAGRFLEHRDTVAISGAIPEEKRRYAFVVNENTVKALGYAKPEQMLGRRIRVGINDIEAEVVGVVKDFHTSSLHKPIEPMVLMNLPEFYFSVGLNLRTSNYTATMAAIETAWKRIYPESLFDAKFLDDSLQELYEDEQRQFSLLRVFAGIALVICCLGLWGLATFTIERRTKEIGVRKVLGASVTGIVALISKDFLKLVLLALVIATPIAWYAMESWLKEFSYRIDVEWWVFALVGAVSILIAFATVSFQSIKAALMNPVTSLRSE
ncbi:ABC transporter permease [Larkinella humicola]|uniref:FtsX-like permease family protein n=1 Tax=Larkinella humicola TaxID=2607654 RepID=A0A5N1JH15_9BACT|nr:ABC transporter permease [Larkinella humicola]KAA9354728.1 FtsX-like permease family protein [Larkinella humicola]